VKTGKMKTNNDKFYPDSEYLSALQAAAEADGRKCVVGALIKNKAGAIFVQKRSMDRSLFPGCWDIAGGHVEPGETLLESLAREIMEETGWHLQEIVSLVKVFDWHEERNGRTIPLREFDFQVRVAGNLGLPRLEAGKFSEFRWINAGELEILQENRPPTDTFIYDLVEQGLAQD
jgi:8-oxo-dGTP pyrophosphatase MutT (NUDIX family)